MTETIYSDDPTTGRAMTVDDGEAGLLVVKLRNLVSELRKELRKEREQIDE